MSEFCIESIQYLPNHRCPLCAAPGIQTLYGIFLPYQELFGGSLARVQDHFGYVWFACACPHKPGPGLRVARWGDAILPLAFVGDRQGEQLDGEINAGRVEAAIQFLTVHARKQDKGKVVEWLHHKNRQETTDITALDSKIEKHRMSLVKK